jgi:hypothetical protein
MGSELGGPVVTARTDFIFFTAAAILLIVAGLLL